jgi:cytochrome c oxidase subunit 3
MIARPAIDVAQLPSFDFGAKAPAWWGNLLFMVIETTTIALLLVSYFYAWQGSDNWPPPHTDASIATADRWPHPGLATLDLFMLIASCLPMAAVDRAARRNDRLTARRGLILLTIIGLTAIALRFYEFPTLRFRWDENTYASLVWAIVFMHLTYLIAATLEVAVVAGWIFRYGMDEKLAGDVTLTAIYWYWMAGLWLLLYVVVFWAPRLL